MKTVILCGALVAFFPLYLTSFLFRGNPLTREYETSVRYLFTGK